MRTSFVLLLALVTPATADEPVVLRWSLKEGDTFYTTTRVSQTHTVTADGKKFETSLGFDFTLRYRVTAVTDEGTKIEVTYLAARVEADGTEGVGKVGEKVRGCSVSIRLEDDRGRIGLRGHDELLKRFRDAPAVERDTAAALFGEGGVRELVCRPFDILPRDGLRVGETNVRDDRGTVGGLTTAGKTTSKLESLTRGVARVSVKSELAISTADTPGVKIDLKAERAGGEYTFDTRTGRLKEFSHETVLGGTITTTADGMDTVVKVAIRQKQTVTVSDKNPIRARLMGFLVSRSSHHLPTRTNWFATGRQSDHFDGTHISTAPGPADQDDRVRPERDQAGDDPLRLRLTDLLPPVGLLGQPVDRTLGCVHHQPAAHRPGRG